MHTCLTFFLPVSCSYLPILHPLQTTQSAKIKWEDNTTAEAANTTTKMSADQSTAAASSTTTTTDIPPKVTADHTTTETTTTHADTATTTTVPSKKTTTTVTTKADGTATETSGTKPRLGGKTWGKSYVPLGMKQATATDACDTEWATILSMLAAVEGRGVPPSTPLSFDSVHREVVSVVAKGKGGWLYEQLVGEIHAAVGRVKNDVSASVDDATPGASVATWCALERYLATMHSLTAYLDQQWVRPRGVASLLCVGHNAVAVSLLPTPMGVVVCQHITASLSLQAVCTARHFDGRAVDLAKTLPREAYLKCIETPLCESYRHDTAQLRVKLLALPLQSVAAELSSLRDDFHLMSERVGLPDSTRTALDQILLSTVFGESGVSAFLEKIVDTATSYDSATVSTMLSFAHDASSDVHIVDAIYSHLHSALSRPTHKFDDVDTMLQYVKYMETISGLFRGRQKEALLHIMAARLDGGGTEEVLARWVDQSMRGSTAETCWRDFARLYDIVSSKDHVEELCRRRLAARLLAHHARELCLDSESLCNERAFLASFKALQPASHTVRRMVQMLKDVGTSFGETRGFLAAEEQEGRSDAKGAAFMVLNKSTWPAYVQHSTPLLTHFEVGVCNFVGFWVASLLRTACK